ncbi:helix-turn-helix domain-containing protein [Enterobacter ludwigii]
MENTVKKPIKSGNSEEKTASNTKNRERIFVTSGINRFSERLKIAMGGMSNNELARRSGMSETTIRKYLKGDIYPGIDSAAIVAHACNVSLIWLLCGIELKDEGINKQEAPQDGVTTDAVLQRLSPEQIKIITDAILEHGVAGIMAALNGMADLSDFMQMTEAERAQTLRLFNQVKKGASEGSDVDTANNPATNDKRAS